MSNCFAGSSLQMVSKTCSVWGWSADLTVLLSATFCTANAADYSTQDSHLHSFDTFCVHFLPLLFQRDSERVTRMDLGPPGTLQAFGLWSWVQEFRIQINLFLSSICSVMDFVNTWLTTQGRVDNIKACSTCQDRDNVRADKGRHAQILLSCCLHCRIFELMCCLN